MYEGGEGLGRYTGSRIFFYWVDISVVKFPEYPDNATLSMVLYIILEWDQIHLRSIWSRDCRVSSRISYQVDLFKVEAEEFL